MNASKPVRPIDSVTDFHGRKVTVGVDYNAVTVDGPKDPVFAVETLDDYVQVLGRARAAAEAYATAHPEDES